MALPPDSNFERCCRLCAEEQDVTIMIFSQEAEAMLLQNKLNKYLLIEVDEDDRLPKNICIQCCTKLQTVCDFIDSAHKAQDTLLNRSLMFEHEPDETNNTQIKSEPLSDDEANITEMEVSVDPLMVLQNSSGPLSPNTVDNMEPDQITYLNGVDGENVTLKLIRKASDPGVTSKTNPPDNDDEKRDDSKPFPCVTCRRSFYTELALKNHSWTHINEEKNDRHYRCSSCNEEFEYKIDLIDHLKEHRVEGMCQLCGRIFRTQKNLASHMAAHLAEGKCYACKVCGRSYNTRSNLKTHSITHSNERPYQCHLCKKSFKRNQDLKFHINQHTGAKPYKCPFCEKSFASSGNCYSHRSRMHPGRRVEENVIHNSIASRGDMKTRQPRAIAPKAPNHPKAPYSPISPITPVRGIFKYQCQLCDHSFMKRDNFTYHMYQHTGEKPFQCTYCDDKFVTRRGLLIHHGKEHPAKTRPLALISKNVLLK